MISIKKTLVALVAFGSIGYVASNIYASITPQEQALKDLKRIELNKLENKMSGNHLSATDTKKTTKEIDKIKSLHVSGLSFPIYKFPFEVGGGTVYFENNKGKSLSELIAITDEELGFVEAGDKIDGIIVTNSSEPVTMTRGYIGEDLADLYNKTLKLKGPDSKVMYFDLDSVSAACGMFITTDDTNKEIVLLGKLAAQELNLQEEKVYSSEEIAHVLEKHIKEFEKQGSSDIQFSGSNETFFTE